MIIIVKLTTDCNLRCVYCSEGDKPPRILSLEYIYKMIDELPAFLDSLNDRNVTLLWHGGEPMTVGTHYLRKVMTYAKEKLAGYGLRFEMQSNLTLLNDEWIELIKEFQIRMGVSLDGYRELHNANRRTKDGKPTFDLVMKNLDRLNSEGIRYGTLMVLNTAAPVDVDQLYDFIKERKLHIKIHAVVPCGRAAGNLHSGEIYNRYIAILESLYEKTIGDMDFEGTIDPTDGLLKSILSGVPVNECAYNGNCGQKFFCLYSTGEFGFCGRAESVISGFGYGHIKDHSLFEIYHSQHADSIRDRQEFLASNGCGHCPDWKLCHGGCAFEALNAYGELNVKYPNCESRRSFIRYLKTTGLTLLKKRLVMERKKYRIAIKSRKEILKELSHDGE